MAKRIFLDFDGFWIERSMDKLPPQSGIYMVYEGLYDEETKSVHLEKLIYVGEADNACESVNGHEKFEEWKGACGEKNELFFAFAPIEGPDRERAMAAIVYEQAPPVNDKYKDLFPFEDTEMEIAGKTGLLVSTFEVVTEHVVFNDDEDEGEQESSAC